MILSTYIVLSKFLQNFTKEIRLSFTVAKESEEDSYVTCPKQYVKQLRKLALSVPSLH